jgi:flavin reductase (DIM6/NTAB) family NADH-FMN oxidoreductase RutF
VAPKRIGSHVGGGPEDPGERSRRQAEEAFRDALAAWPAGVALAAVRDGDAVRALTVSSLIPVTVDPPLVLVSLGPNAPVRPFLDPGSPLTLSVLAASQKGLAARYADTFPVGPSPFPETGPPVAQGALAGLVCEVDELLERGDHLLVIARVVQARSAPDGPALAYFRRAYRTVG